MDGRERERDAMVRDQLAARGISDLRVLQALRTLPRHRFVPLEYAAQAYEDRPLPIGMNQTISQPYMVGCMTEFLAPQPEDRILEIGTGSGYQAALLAMLCKELVSIERHPELQERARTCLQDLGLRNATLLCADGSLGYSPKAPYDGIMITAGSPRIPEALLGQLADGGRLVCPVGDRTRQQLRKVEKQGNKFNASEHTECVFVPLVGRNGWPVGDE